VEYGYEPNDDWLKQLEGVRAKPQTYGEKHPSLFKRLETDLRYQLKSRAYLGRRRQPAPN
jgi:hypothetical protein